MKAVLCPVCNGTGKIGKNEGIEVPNGHFAILEWIRNEITCHGCGGKGWVEVFEEFNWYYPPCEYPYTYPYYMTSGGNFTWVGDRFHGVS